MPISELINSIFIGNNYQLVHRFGFPTIETISDNFSNGKGTMCGLKVIMMVEGVLGGNLTSFPHEIENLSNFLHVNLQLQDLTVHNDDILQKLERIEKLCIEFDPFIKETIYGSSINFRSTLEIVQIQRA